MTDEQLTDSLAEPEVTALARVYTDRFAASQLLSRAGLAREFQPDPAGNSWLYWRAVNQILEGGILAGGRRKILECALKDYPANEYFRAGHDAAIRAETSGVRRGDGLGPVRSRPPAAGHTGVRADSTSRYRSAGLPVQGTVVVLDAVGYSQLIGQDKRALRDGLHLVVGEGLARSLNVSPEIQEHASQDRGDGFLVVLPGETQKALVVADFVRELKIVLDDYNRTRNDLGRIRLRLALHAGDVLPDGTGWADGTVVVAARLVDSAPIRESLKQNTKADLAVILSPELYRSVVVERLRGLNPDDFQEVAISIADKYTGTGWLTVPGFGRPPLPADATAAGPAPAGPAGGAADAAHPSAGWAGGASAAAARPEPRAAAAPGPAPPGATATPATSTVPPGGPAALSVSPPAARAAAPVVFISYTHESVAHSEAVRDLWAFLRANGVDAVLDRPAAERPQDWQLWMERQLRRADYVLVIATDEYRRRADGLVPSDVGRGLLAEAALIRGKLYADRDKWFDRVLAVLLPGHRPEEIPDWLGPYSKTHYPISQIDDDGCERLLRVLLDLPYETVPPLGPAPALLPRSATAGAGETASPAALAGTPPADAPGADGYLWDFYVTAAAEDSGWGDWIAWYLRRSGHRVRFETVAGETLVGSIDEGVRRSRRTVLVLSNSYLNSTEVTAAWQAALGRDLIGLQRTLIPVRVERCDPDGLIGNIRYIDLVDRDAEDAHRHFVEQIRRSVEGVYRPSTAPPFPGKPAS